MTTNSTTTRPWGTFEVIQDTPCYKLKKIVVQSGKRLSLQSHQHRSEHWICLSGHGYAQINDQMISLYPGVHVFIEKGSKHRMINDSDSDQQLEIIELQTGSYFGEDDIIRYEDDYGRQ